MPPGAFPCRPAGAWKTRPKEKIFSCVISKRLYNLFCRLQRETATTGTKAEIRRLPPFKVSLPKTNTAPYSRPTDFDLIISDESPPFPSAQQPRPFEYFIRLTNWGLDRHPEKLSAPNWTRLKINDNDPPASGNARQID